MASALTRESSEELVAKAIDEVLPSSDPFDDANFDAINLVNSYFPSEMSLASVEAACDKLGEKMNQLDANILHAVEQQSSAGNAAKKDLQEANNHVNMLTEKLARIRGKSETTENMVRDICSDIVNLDHAKRNLTTTITALRRLNMLENAVEQLSELTTERAYKEAANLLEAVSQLALNFESYKAVPKVCELLASVRALRSQLQAQVYEEFRMHVDLEMSPEVAEMLADAAQVVTVLGPGLVARVVNWFCDKELTEYENLHDPNKQPATLEGVDRRYVWLRKWFRSYSSTYEKIMPASWNVPKTFAESFCERTKSHLSVLLQRASKDMDVRLLLHVIQKSLELEQELTNRFFPDIVRETASQREESSAETAAATRKPDSSKGFEKAISRVFKPYMSLYLKLERAQLADLVKSLLTKETWGKGVEEDEVDDDEHPVLASTGELFLYIKRSLGQCTAVDHGETLLHLSKIFEETLRLYGEGLHKQVVEISRNRSGGAKAMSIEEERTVAMVINTSDYCVDTMEQLEGSVIKAIDPTLASQISYSGMKDSFDGAIDACLTALVTSCVTKMDTALAAMGKIRWADFDVVGDTSPYVNAVQAVLKECIPPLRDTLSESFFGMLCDKWAANFFPRLLVQILKIRKVNDTAVQQLLLDVHSIRTVVLGLPTIGLPQGKGKVGKSFQTLVNTESSKIESLLKVLLSPPEQVEQNYNALIKGGDSRQLQRILEMKGLRASTSQSQVFDVMGETLSAGQAITERAMGKIDQESFRKNFDSVAGKVVGHVSSTVAKTFT